MKLFFSKHLRVLIEYLGHLLFWYGYISLVNNQLNKFWIDDGLEPNHIPLYLLVIALLIFYINTLYLAPRYFKRKSWYKYLLWVFTLITSSLLFLVLFDHSISISLNHINHKAKIFIGLLTDMFQVALIYNFVKGYFVKDRLINTLTLQKLKSELDTLKMHVNPHFLFNSLNAADTLIDKNPEMAKLYIKRLSDLYRFSLENLSEDLIPLKKELEFIENYIYLVNKRFGNIYKLEYIDLEDAVIDELVVPPSSIQTLIENAVKHNTGSIEKPLNIRLKISDNYIKITNEKCFNKAKNSSLGTGLKTLKSRMAFFSEKAILIEDGNTFSVSVPLIYTTNKNI